MTPEQWSAGLQPGPWALRCVRRSGGLWAVQIMLSDDGLWLLVGQGVVVDDGWSMGSGSGGGLPGGTVTFVLGDVVGSTAMWETDAEIAAEAIAALDGLVGKLVQAHDGARPVEQGEGDSFVAAFAHPSDAARFAVALQQALLDPSDGSRPLPVRVGVHTGEARLHDGVYRGEALNRCARIRALAHGGQILVSGPTAELVVDGLDDPMFLKDLGRHRLRDLQRPEHLRQLCHPELLRDFPPLRSLDRLPNNLPLQLTSFVGRDRELSEVGSLLTDHRVVTLTGAGGSGKTRLALQLAAATLDTYEDGTWLVDLASITDPELVPRAVAEVLGVRELPQEPLSGAIVRYLGDRVMLLVMDNCEHLIDRCAETIATIVQACDHVTVLATSREPLSVTGEVTFRVSSLAVPDGPEVAECASVELFAARAAAVRSGFRVSSTNAEAVASICRRLDGLPLAIELAAAHCRSLSPEQIAQQLSGRFSLLSGGSRTALPRQRTLEASVGWSVELLDDDERSLLRRLSVFAGGFDLDAAERVSGIEEAQRWRVVELMTGLVDKSLVQADDDGPTVRYRLLETVRHFAAQQLVEVGDAQGARDAHADHYVGLVRTAGPSLMGARDREASVVLDRELDNIRAALAWLVECGDAARALALAQPLHVFWSRHASRDVLRTLHDVLALEGGADQLRGRLHCTGAEVAWLMGDLDRNAAHLERAALCAGRSNDAELAHLVALYRGWRGILLEDPDAPDVLLGAAHGLRDLGSFYWSSDAFYGRAVCEMFQGHFDAASRWAEEGVIDARRSANPVAIMRAVMVHALTWREIGALEKASDMMDEADALQAEVTDRSTATLAAAGRAALDALMGRHELAYDGAIRTAEESRRAGLIVSLAQSLWSAVLASWFGTGRCDLALLDEATAFTGAVGLHGFVAAASAIRAEIALAAGQLDDARAACDEALRIADEHVFAGIARPAAMLTDARIRRAQGLAADDTAREILAGALDGGGRLDAIDAIELLATIAAEQGHLEEAARLLGASDRARDDLHAPRTAPRKPTFDATRGALEAVLGADRLEELITEGATLTLEDAHSYIERGRGEQRRAIVGWESLTPTEQRVVALVEQGLKNADIAKQLFISVPTVKTHLSHIFSKLDVATRAELAAAAARRS